MIKLLEFDAGDGDNGVDGDNDDVFVDDDDDDGDVPDLVPPDGVHRRAPRRRRGAGCRPRSSGVLG